MQVLKNKCKHNTTLQSFTQNPPDMCSMGRPWCWIILVHLDPFQVCQDALKDSKEALATFRDLQLPECADLNVWSTRWHGSHPTWHSSLNWGHCAKRNPPISVISVKLPGREAIGCDTESLLEHKQKSWLVHFDSKFYSRFGNMNWVGTLLPIRGSYAVNVKLVTPKNWRPNTKNPRKTLVSQFWSVPNLWKLNPWWSMLKSEIIWIFGWLVYVTIW